MSLSLIHGFRIEPGGPMMMRDETEKTGKPTDEMAKEGRDTRDRLEASAELRRTMMKRLAVSGFLAPAVLVTLLKQPATAS